MPTHARVTVMARDRKGLFTTSEHLGNRARHSRHGSARRQPEDLPDGSDVTAQTPKAMTVTEVSLMELFLPRVHRLLARSTGRPVTVFLCECTGARVEYSAPRLSTSAIQGVRELGDGPPWA